MVAFRSILPMSLTLAICAAGAAGQTQPPQSPAPASAGAGAPMRLTTDSVQYCSDLVRRVETTPALSDEVLMLVREGQRMCAQGLVIGGVARLRRALMLAQGIPQQP